MRTIRGRLIATYLLMALLTLLISGVVLQGVIRRHFLASAEETLLAQAQEIARVVGERRRLQWEETPAMLSRLISNLTSGWFVVVDPRGVVQAASRDSGRLLGTRFLPPFVAEALQRGEPRTAQSVEPLGAEPAVAVAVPVRWNDQVNGAVVLMRPVLAIQVAGRRLLATLLLAGAAAVLAALVMSYVLSVNVFRPLAELGQAARDIARGRLDRRVVPTGAGDEVAQLVEHFNDMADRIARLVHESGEEQARMRAVLASTADPLLAVDHNVCVVLLNGKMAELCRFEPEAAVGRSLGECVPPGLAALLAETPGVRPLRREYEWVGVGVFEVNATALDTPEGGQVVVLRDLTEQKRLDQQRREFLSMISHELRTPVTSIQGFLEALSEDVVQEPAARRRYLDILAAEARRLRRLIDDLFDYARLELGQLELVRAPLDLAALVRTVVEGAVATTSPGSHQLELEVPAEPVLVNGDRDRLSQVLWNLLANSLQYTPPGGRIRVRVAVGPLSAQVKLEDSGPGIPKEELPRVFDRFYRSRSGRLRRPGGLGLGLFVARSLIEAHGGTIAAESGSDGGSAFSFTLPLMVC